VGVASFVLDLGLLIVLHEIFQVELWIATPVAFLVSLVFNFVLQRVFTFQAVNSRRSSALKYGLLVVFNTVATDVIVTAFDRFGIGYEIGKVFATAITMVWNYFIYKYWIFAAPSNRAEAAADQSVR
jgi:putative flippase GtrA